MFFSKLFGGKSDKENQDSITPAQAIQRLRETEEMLNKKAEFLEKQYQEQMKVVKANGTRNKRLALNALKKAKRLEKQREQVEGTLTTLEAQRETLENAATNVETLKALTEAGKALKKSHGNMDLNKVEDLMDEMREQQEIADEISQVIRTGPGFDSQFDEDDLMKELEDLEQEELDKQLINPEPLPTVPQNELPSVPEAASSSKAKDDVEDQLEKLKQWGLS